MKKICLNFLILCKRSTSLLKCFEWGSDEKDKYTAKNISSTSLDNYYDYWVFNTDILSLSIIKEESNNSIAKLLKQIIK